MPIQVPRRYLDYFRRAVKEMSRRSSVYRMLRDELTLQGHWKQKPRGKKRTAFPLKRGPEASSDFE